jgi:hypothetical protein
LLWEGRLIERLLFLSRFAAAFGYGLSFRRCSRDLKVISSLFFWILLEGLEDRERGVGRGKFMWCWNVISIYVVCRLN